MLNVNGQYLLAMTSKRISFCVCLFVISISNTFADSGHYKVPESIETKSAYDLPTNLDETSLAKLMLLKKQCNSNLKLLQPFKIDLGTSEVKLLGRLIAYDNIRLKISEVIIKLVDEYNVTGSYKKKLLGYCDTFSGNIKHAQDSVRTLAEYKVYGTHFAVAYISLIYTFKENPIFYAKYERDIKDPESTIGIFISELADSYREVEKAHKEYESALLAQKIRQSIAQLDKEINLRKSRLITQYNADSNAAANRN